MEFCFRPRGATNNFCALCKILLERGEKVKGGQSGQSYFPQGHTASVVQGYCCHTKDSLEGHPSSTPSQLVPRVGSMLAHPYRSNTSLIFNGKRLFKSLFNQCLEV